MMAPPMKNFSRPPAIEGQIGRRFADFLAAFVLAHPPWIPFGAPGDAQCFAALTVVLERTFVKQFQQNREM